MYRFATSSLLVVGGNGLVGGGLVRRLEEEGVKVISTSRTNMPNCERIYLDILGNDFDSLIELNPSTVIVCAAMTNMLACEREPETSRRINVVSTVELVREMLSCGAFVVFLSSNTVFDGNTLNVAEDHPYCPTTEYGHQKAAAEQQLLKLPSADCRLAIVRLSKVVSPDSGIAADFLHRLQEGQSCEAFEDLLLCPASINYIIDGLIRIAMARIPGVFHLSGEEEMSYAQFARSLASAIGADGALVRATTSEAKGIEVLFRPRHPALGMVKTGTALGLLPEPRSHLINELVNSCMA